MSMSDRQTQALLLRVAGHSFEEIASRMGITKARAHQLVSKASASARYRARVGVVAPTVEGMDAGALGGALREYVAGLGIKDPTVAE